MTPKSWFLQQQTERRDTAFSCGRRAEYVVACRGCEYEEKHSDCLFAIVPTHLICQVLSFYGSSATVLTTFVAVLERVRLHVPDVKVPQIFAFKSKSCFLPLI